MHKTMYDNIIARANCPHFRLELIDGVWTLIYEDHEKGVYDRMTTKAWDGTRNKEYWVMMARKFIKRHYVYPVEKKIGVVTVRGVVHHIEMTTRTEDDSFPIFQLCWYGYAGRPETEDMVAPIEQRVVHKSLWAFYDAIGWDHKARRFNKEADKAIREYSGWVL